MYGARIRSYSLSGTPPEKTSHSVPRLMRAEQRADAHVAAAGGARRSARISALPGADIPERLRYAAWSLAPDSTLNAAARYIPLRLEKHPMSERTLNIAATRPSAP